MFKFLERVVLLQFIILIYLVHRGGATNIRVIDTFGDGSLSYGVTQKRDFATVSEDAVSNLPSKITICSSVKAETGPNVLAFFQLLDDNGSSILATQLYNFQELPSQRVKINGGVNDKLFYAEIDVVYLKRYWVHACTHFDSATGNVIVLVNGEKALNATINPAKLPNSLKNNLVLGNTRIGNWYTTRGKVTNLNVYSGQLSDEVMIEKTSGSGCGVSDGDYLSWSNIQMSLEGEATWTSISVPELCEKGSSLVVFTAIMPAGDCINLCPKMQQGHAARVVTPEDKKSLHSFIKKISFVDGVGGAKTESGKKSVATWIPIRRVGDKWVDEMDKSVVISSPAWCTGYPTGGDCALYAGALDCWISWDCNMGGHVGMCSCSFPVKPKLILRGLCKASNLDHNFIPQNHFTYGSTSHYGLFQTEMNFTDGFWRMHVFNSPTKAFTKEASDNSFALGKYNWTIEGDQKDCNEGKPYSRLLKLTGCLEGEFTCSDGQCVNMEQRCDQISHCRDESDENGCKLMVIKESYNKKVPPIGGVTNNGEVIPATVKVTIVLKDIIAIEETRHKIALKFSIRLKWHENRAQFYNLKRKSFLNALSQKEIENMWLPLVIYDNTDQNEAVKLAEDVDTTVTVSKEGGFTPSGIDVTDEIKIYEGNPMALTGGNPVEMRQTYSKEFKCEYQLHRYPFDIQVCAIDMAVTDLELSSTRLIPGQIIMESQQMLTMYIITTYTIQYRNVSNPAMGIQMKITLKRRVVNELLTTYLPSVLLILISYSTTFFKPYYFEAALTVNLTTMLVITTLFIAVMDKLPSTAYVKFVDIWLIFGQLIPFTEVCLLTAIELYRDDTGGMTINHHGQPRTVAKINEPTTSYAEVGSLILVIELYIFAS